MVHTTSTTLHLHYDLEKPGYQGLDRRHFPARNRVGLTEPVYKPRGRAHIPSPPLQDEQWRPHGRHIAPAYSNVGPDWQSRLRYIPPPNHPDAKPTLPVGVIERNFHFMRPYPQNWQRSKTDWNYFPDESIDHLSSKRNHFANMHLRSIEDLGDDNVYMAQIGHKRAVFNSRNGLDKRSDGDKSYRTVEWSPDFHKLGSTLPSVHFGREKKSHERQKSMVVMKNDKISVLDEDAFEKKERQEAYNQNVDEVLQLDRWKPAETITSAFRVLDHHPTENNTSAKYRPRVR